MSRNYQKQKQIQKTIAQHRIDYLFELAENVALHGKLDLANRYIQLARKLAMRHTLSLSSKYKRRFCTHCYSFLLPSVTCRVRITNTRITTYCYTCKQFQRFPLTKKIKKKSPSPSNTLK